MTSTLTTDRPRPAPAARPATRWRATAARFVWVWPVLLTALVTRYQAGRPQLWRDEFATWSAATRGGPELDRLAEHIDAVLTPYYWIMRAWIAVAGDSPLAMRTPSVLAMAAAGGVLTVLGARLFSARAGLLGGLLFATLPIVSRYGQEARPYAPAALAAVVSTLLLVQALDRPRWWRWALYAAALVVLGQLNLVAMVLVAGHLVAVVAARSARIAGWALAALAAAGLPLLPLVLRGRGQQAAQLGAADRPPTWEHLVRMPDGVFGAATVAGIVLLLAVLAAVADRRGAVLGGIVLAPALTFVAAAMLSPLWNTRYLIFLVPLACVLAGAALSRLPLAAAVAVVVLTGCLGLIEHGQVRESHESRGSRAIDYRGAAGIVRSHAQPGDGIVYAPRPGWQFTDIAVEYYLRGDAPHDVLRLVDRNTRGDFWTTERTDVADALAGTGRVWTMVADNLTTRRPEQLPAGTRAALEADFRPAGRWRVSGIAVALWERR